MSNEDNMIDIELDLEDDLLFDLMLEAHRRDITLNQMVQLILTRAIEERQNEQQNNTTTPTSEDQRAS